MLPACSNLDCRPSRAARRADRRGFTLIEVLATLLLLAIVLPAIMRAVVIASSAGNAAKRRTEAGALAESKINELVNSAYNNNMSAIGTNGTFPDWPDYSWTAEIQPYVNGQNLGVEGANSLQQLDVHVSWPPHGPKDMVTVTTVIYPVTNTNASSTSGLSGGSP